MMLDVLMGLIWMFSAFFLIWWIIKSPIYDLEELVALVKQVSELWKHLQCLCKVKCLTSNGIDH